MGKRKPSLRDDAAAEKLYLDNEKLLNPILDKHIPKSIVKHIGRETCYSWAAEAMWRACHLWDKEKANLSTYVYRSVLNYILRKSKEEWSIIHVPYHIHCDKRMDPRTVRYRGLARKAEQVSSIRSDEYDSFGDAKTHWSAADEMIDVEEKRLLHNAISSLPNPGRIILELRTYEEWTLQQVGEHLGVTRERVRQLEKVALGKLAGVIRKCKCQV